MKAIPPMFSPQSRAELKSAVDACKPAVCLDESCCPIGWYSDDVACSFVDTSVALQTDSTWVIGGKAREESSQVVSVRVGIGVMSSRICDDNISQEWTWGSDGDSGDTHVPYGLTLDLYSRWYWQWGSRHWWWRSDIEYIVTLVFIGTDTFIVSRHMIFEYMHT